MPFPTPCPQFNSQVHFRSKISFRVETDLSNPILFFLKKIKGCYCLRPVGCLDTELGAWIIVCWCVSLVFFSSMPFSCPSCACFFSALLTFLADFALHSLASGGSRVSFQLLEGKSRCQNEGVANASLSAPGAQFLRSAGGCGDEASLEVSQIHLILSAL